MQLKNRIGKCALD